jgi:hypothetical protein
VNTESDLRLRIVLECGGKRVLVGLVLRKGERDTPLDGRSALATALQGSNSEFTIPVTSH